MGMMAVPRVVRSLDARAGIASALASFLTVAVAAAGFGAALGDWRPTIWSLIVLALGIALGQLVDSDSWFDSVSGLVFAFPSVVLALLLYGVAQAILTLPEPNGYLALVAMLVIGLDWHRVTRLRIVVLLSGMLVLPLLRPGLSGFWLLGLAWMVGMWISLWLLSQDALRELPRPTPLTRVQSRVATGDPVDLLRVVGLAGLVAGASVLGWLALSALFDNETDSATQDPGRTMEAGGNGEPLPGAFGSDSTVVPGGGSGGTPPTNPVGRDGSLVPSSLPGNTFPEGVGTSGPGAENSLGPGASGDAADPLGDLDESSGNRAPPYLAFGLLGLAVLGLMAWWWLGQREELAARPAPSWPERLTEHLQREGELRGQPRRRSETVVMYGRRLSHGALPDDRVAAVGDLISAALFSNHPVSTEQREWAERTVEEVLAAYPAEQWDRSRDSLSFGSAPSD